MRFFSKKDFNDESCWKLISNVNQKALKKDPDLNSYLSIYLSKSLRKLSISNLLKFNLFITQRDKDLQTDTLAGVCWMINEVGHGDTFWDFRSWIIYMGKEVFEIALNNPDELIYFVRKADDEYLSLVDGGPSPWTVIDELSMKNKISKEQYSEHEKQVEEIRQKPFRENNSWNKHLDLKMMFPKLAEYVEERDGPNCFND